MHPIKDQKSLKEAIANLEAIHKAEGQLLKQRFEFTIDRLNPINIIKDKFTETLSSPLLKNTVVQSAFGLLGGFLTNKLIVGSSKSVLKKVLATFIQTTISKFGMK